MGIDESGSESVVDSSAGRRARDGTRRGMALSSRQNLVGTAEYREKGPVEVPPESSLYEDMKWVRRYPKSMDGTEGQRDAREWKRKDLKGFMQKFADMEKASAVVAASGAPGGAPDEGSVRVEGLIEELLVVLEAG